MHETDYTVGYIQVTHMSITGLMPRNLLYAIQSRTTYPRLSWRAKPAFKIFAWDRKMNISKKSNDMTRIKIHHKAWLSKFKYKCPPIVLCAMGWISERDFRTL